jgi:hypothetical protein
MLRCGLARHRPSISPKGEVDSVEIVGNEKEREERALEKPAELICLMQYARHGRPYGYVLRSPAFSLVLLSRLALRLATAPRLPLAFAGKIFDLVRVDVEHDLAATRILVPDHQLRRLSVFNLSTVEIRNKNCLAGHRLLLLTNGIPLSIGSLRVSRLRPRLDERRVLIQWLTSRSEWN